MTSLQLGRVWNVLHIAHTCAPCVPRFPRFLQCINRTKNHHQSQSQWYIFGLMPCGQDPQKDSWGHQQFKLTMAFSNYPEFTQPNLKPLSILNSMVNQKKKKNGSFATLPSIAPKMLTIRLVWQWKNISKKNRNGATHLKIGFSHYWRKLIHWTINNIKEILSTPKQPKISVFCDKFNNLPKLFQAEF